MHGIDLDAMTLGVISIGHASGSKRMLINYVSRTPHVRTLCDAWSLRQPWSIKITLFCDHSWFLWILSTHEKWSQKTFWKLWIADIFNFWMWLNMKRVAERRGRSAVFTSRTCNWVRWRWTDALWRPRWVYVCIARLAGLGCSRFHWFYPNSAGN